VDDLAHGPLHCLGTSMLMLLSGASSAACESLRLG
jgi:hypothetical protein